jgi:hypothetical protein
MADDWSVEAHRLFKEHGVRQVGYVPDGGLTTSSNHALRTMICRQ